MKYIENDWSRATVPAKIRTNPGWTKFLRFLGVRSRPIICQSFKNIFVNSLSKACKNINCKANVLMGSCNKLEMVKYICENNSNAANTTGMHQIAFGCKYGMFKIQAQFCKETFAKKRIKMHFRDLVTVYTQKICSIQVTKLLLNLAGVYLRIVT